MASWVVGSMDYFICAHLSCAFFLLALSSTPIAIFNWSDFSFGRSFNSFTHIHFCDKLRFAQTEMSSWHNIFFWKWKNNRSVHNPLIWMFMVVFLRNFSIFLCIFHCHTIWMRHLMHRHFCIIFLTNKFNVQCSIFYIWNNQILFHLNFMFFNFVILPWIFPPLRAISLMKNYQIQIE